VAPVGLDFPGPVAAPGARDIADDAHGRQHRDGTWEVSSGIGEPSSALPTLPSGPGSAMLTGTEKALNGRFALTRI